LISKSESINPQNLTLITRLNTI